MIGVVDDRDAIAWLHRRVGFGLAPGQLDELTSRGVDRVLDELLDPDAHGVAPAPDPWEGLDFSAFDPDDGDAKAMTRAAVGGWIKAMITTPRPLHEWLRWFWHGHFTSSLPEVRHPNLMIRQLRMYHDHALGDLRTFLREVTIDPAMLVYLDGHGNEKGRVNENYGRELLELFALGIGAYTEEDVRAGAEALTGWKVVRESVPTGPESRFRPALHDDAPKRFLGRDGVHDVDTVIDAVVAHEACAPFVTRKLARAVLGSEVDQGLVDRLAGEFRDGGLVVAPLLRSLLEAGLDGASTGLLSGPVSWLTRVMRACAAPLDATLEAAAAGNLQPAGQIPMLPPNVAGWPGGRAWLTSSATVARITMAATIADATPDGPLRAAASSGPDVGALADALGYPEGFASGSRDALQAMAARGGRSVPAGVLAVAYAAPEVVQL